MPIDRIKIGREIRAQIGRDREIPRATKEFAEKVRDHIIAHEAPKPGPDHPYSKGGFIESIRVRQSRDDKGRFISAFEVYSDHPNANFIEFGTGPDKPGSRSPWGPNTPTPEFAPFAKAAFHFGGTAP